VAVRNKSPFILAGYTVRRAAERGFVGITWSVAISKVAPWGSIDPIIGTNPLSLGFPADPQPIVLDLATTKIPAAEIRRADRLGLAIPEGVAVAADGRPTSDPAAALEGAMEPFGEHKGSGIGIMIELLGGALVGAKVGRTVSGPRGMVFVAIDAHLFVDAASLRQAVESFSNELRGSRRRPGFDAVLLPGERGEHLKQKALRDGLDIDDSVYEALVDLASGGR
jgi:L-2-hydroxycarboxylate dehydrogenase (NAD+)